MNQVTHHQLPQERRQILSPRLRLNQVWKLCIAVEKLGRSTRVLVALPGSLRLLDVNFRLTYMPRPHAIPPEFARRRSRPHPTHSPSTLQVNIQ